MRVSPRTLRGPEIVRRRRHRRTPNLNVVRPILQGLETRCLLSGPDPFPPTADERYLLALINRARAHPAAEGQRLLAIARNDPAIGAATRNWDLNQFLEVIDSYGPLPPLAFNTGLIEAARDHDAAMLAATTQFHSPSGDLNNPQVATAANGQAYYPTGTYGVAVGNALAGVPPRRSGAPVISSGPTTLGTTRFSRATIRGRNRWTRRDLSVWRRLMMLLARC
jgi:hypothetical protein